MTAWKNIPYECNPNITYPAWLYKKQVAKTISRLAPHLKGRLLDLAVAQNLTKAFLQ